MQERPNALHPRPAHGGALKPASHAPSSPAAVPKIPPRRYPSRLPRRGSGYGCRGSRPRRRSRLLPLLGIAAASGSAPDRDAAAPRETEWALLPSALARPEPEAGDLDRRAAVHDDTEALRFGAHGSGSVAHAELHPHDPGARRDRRIDCFARGLAAAEHIDHIHRFRHLGEARITALTIDYDARRKRVDRYRTVAVLLQIPHDTVARPLGTRARADHRNRLHLGQDVAQIIVRIAVVVHGTITAAPT